VKKSLVERPTQPLSGLGNGRITGFGIDVVQGTTSPPLSILLHQRITVQDVQVGEGDIENVSDTKLNVPMDHSEASKEKPKSSFERITKRMKYMIEKFWLDLGSRSRQSSLAMLPVHAHAEVLWVQQSACGSPAIITSA
jgi:hypothetical protein